MIERAALKSNLIYVGLFLLVLSSAGLAVSGMAFNAFLILAGGMALFLISAQPAYGIIAFLALFLLSYPEFLRKEDFLTPNNILGLVFCFLLYLHLQRERDVWFLRTRQIQLMAAIGLVFIISFLLAEMPPPLLTDPRVTGLIKKEMWDYFTQFAFVIFMIHFIRTGKDVKMILALLMSLIAVSAFSATFFGMGSGDDYRAASSFGIKMARNSNHLAFYSLFAIATLWYWRRERKSTLLKILSLACIAGLVYVVFLSASRNAFLNILFLGLIMLVESGVKLDRIIATLLLIGALGIMVVNFVPEQNIKRITALQADPRQKEASKSLSERAQTLRTGLKIFREHNVLIGIGPGNFRWMRLLQYDRKKWATHNSYLWAILSGGIIALVLYLLLFWKTWKDLRWTERQPTTGSSPPIWAVKTIRTGLLLFLLFSFFTEAWLEAMLFLIIGLAISMKRMYPAADIGQMA